MAHNTQTWLSFKGMVLATLVASISLLHYWTAEGLMYHHIVLRELYFLPIVLGGIWFGLKGSMGVSLAITSLYLPFTLMKWQGLSPMDTDRLTETGLFNIIALILGILRDREWRKEEEKLEAILAMAATVAHSLNSPLQVLKGNTQLLLEDTRDDKQISSELQENLEQIKSMEEVVRRMAGIDKIKLTDYDSDHRILDLDREERERGGR